MPNPNEMYRKEIEMKNEALKSYQDSRNSLTDHHRWCQELRESLKKIETGRLSKSDKERLLGRIRELERLTGYSVGDYNSSGFGIK